MAQAAAHFGLRMTLTHSVPQKCETQAPACETAEHERRVDAKLAEIERAAEAKYRRWLASRHPKPLVVSSGKARVPRRG